MSITNRKRRRLTVPFEIIIDPIMVVRRKRLSDPESWLTSDFEWIKGQCGPEFGHIPTDDVTAQCGNLRRAGKLGRLTKGGHGQGPIKPTPTWYQEYLKTDHWVNRRTKFLDMWRGQCVVCTKPAKQVHHRHYDTLWDEGRFDCIPLCNECHRKFHGRMNHVPDEPPKRLKMLGHK